MEAAIARLLEVVDGPGWEGREVLDQVVSEVRAFGAEQALTLLAAQLTSPDWQVRRQAITAILFVDAGRGVDLVLPLLDDPEHEVRWHTCGCLHDFGDERAVGPLVAILEGSSDTQMRSTAAYALGGVRSPAAIPALLRALDNDQEPDILGHSASSCAATALGHLVGTERASDLGRLRELAQARYRAWSTRPA